MKKTNEPKTITTLVGAIKVNHQIDRQRTRAGVHSLLDMLDPVIPPLKGGQVVLKINLCLLFGSETGATVDPFVVRCFADWLFAKRGVGEIVIAESDATHMCADIAYKALGWDTCFRDLENVRFLNLSRDALIEVDSQRTFITKMPMSETYMNCDWLVSVAKLKTHTEQIITCTMKNIFGAIPEKVKYVYHPRLTEAICDANSARVPDFGFIDGLIAMENDGPTKGTPRRTDLLLAGNNPVALDHYAATLMGFKPGRVPHLKMALARGIGSDKYEILNPDIEPCNPPFAFMPSWKQAIRWGVKKLKS